MESLFSSETVPYILPFIIFFSRIIDVSLGTIRIIFVNRGMRNLAPIIGFFEVLVWLIVINQVMKNVSSPINYIAYAAGFAAGNYVGIFLEQKLAMGITLIRIITRKDATQLIADFRARGFRVTNVPATANSGKVEILFLPVLRKDIPSVIAKVEAHNPNAVYTIEDVRAVSQSALPKRGYHAKDGRPRQRKIFFYRRKGK
ncbi:MAG: DUF2179 domain-containing protein [Candidatus Cloacimonetes bacterium]|nr:DUF2179 domain-containing protein [Candidatus Cloacimonadota bacterium]